MERKPPEAVAAEVMAGRYAGADVLLLAGSVVRGEDTATSDLDLVVLFERLPRARRESFRCGGWPVEAFVHDAATLRYFFREVDRPGGVPSLAGMVLEGREVPAATALSRAAKREAQAVVDAGPPPWGREEVDRSRYAITDLADDLRAPRTPQELRAAAARLHALLADHYLRSRQLWSARGKTIPRRLAAVSPDYARAFNAAFDRALASADADALVALCERTLAPDGGWLFEGYVLAAPESWRQA